MTKFRSKPIVVDAIQWVGDARALIQWREQWPGRPVLGVDMHFDLGATVAITTREGTIIARRGDWIIRGLNGEFSVCKPDMFDATYEPADVDE